jgi:hypothetical protein
MTRRNAPRSAPGERSDLHLIRCAHHVVHVPLVRLRAALGCDREDSNGELPRRRRCGTASDASVGAGQARRQAECNGGARRERGADAQSDRQASGVADPRLFGC